MIPVKNFCSAKKNCTTPAGKYKDKNTFNPSATLKLKLCKNVEEKIYQRNDEWCNNVLLTLANQADLGAAEVKYHRGCALIYLMSNIFYKR